MTPCVVCRGVLVRTSEKKRWNEFASALPAPQKSRNQRSATFDPVLGSHRSGNGSGQKLFGVSVFTRSKAQGGPKSWPESGRTGNSPDQHRRTALGTNVVDHEIKSRRDCLAVLAIELIIWHLPLRWWSAHAQNVRSEKVEVTNVS